MGRAPCCEKVGLRKGKWTVEEDQALTNYIQANGEGSWRSLPKNAGLMRCGKSCRLRWVNYLRGNLKRGNITAEEEDTMVKLHASLGHRWSLIASHFPGRTDNEIKNYWKSHLSRKLYAFKLPFTNGDTATTTHQYLPKSASKIRRGRVSRSVAKKHNNNKVIPSTTVKASPTTMMRKNDVPNDHQNTERMSLYQRRDNTETSMNHNNAVEGSGVDDVDRGKNRGMGENLEPCDEEGGRSGFWSSSSEVGNWYSLFQSPVIGWGSVDDDFKLRDGGEESFCLWDTDSFIWEVTDNAI